MARFKIIGVIIGILLLSAAAVAQEKTTAAPALSADLKLEAVQLQLDVQKTQTKAVAAQSAQVQAQLLNLEAQVEMATHNEKRVALEKKLLKALGAADGCTFDWDKMAATGCPDPPKKTDPKTPERSGL